jgi:hypothetical protein
MKIDDVTKYYGNLNKACIALGIAAQNMTKWKRQGYIPWKQQFKLAMLTEGELMPDDEDPQILKQQGRL